MGAIEPQFYANLCKGLGLEKWIPHQQDDAVQDRIRADFRAAFLERDRDEWVAELAPADACVAPVYDVAEIAGDPHLLARGAFTQARHAQHGAYRQVAPVLAGMARPEKPVPVRDASDTDVDSLLVEAGVPSPEIESMRRAGIVA